MNVHTLLSKTVSLFAGVFLMLFSLIASADFYRSADGGTSQFNPHNLTDIHPTIPLFSIHVSASPALMKGNTLDLVASYRTLGLNQDTTYVQYNELSTRFSVAAPRIKGLDFSQSIREKVENSPEKLIDKMIIDGAVGFNYQW